MSAPDGQQAILSGQIFIQKGAERARIVPCRPDRCPFRVIFDGFNGDRRPVDVRFCPVSAARSVAFDRTLCDSNSQTGRANTPPKSNRRDPICFSPHLSRARNRVERFFNKIKQCRRIATCYDKLAANFLAFVQLASIRLRLAAVNESTP